MLHKMAENFTVYSFQLRPDDFTRFYGSGYDDADENENESETDTYSEEEFGNKVFAFQGGFEKHIDVPVTDPSIDDTEFNPTFDESVFETPEPTDNIFDISEIDELEVI